MMEISQARRGAFARNEVEAMMPAMQDELSAYGNAFGTDSGLYGRRKSQIDAQLNARRQLMGTQAFAGMLQGYQGTAQDMRENLRLSVAVTEQQKEQARYLSEIERLKIRGVSLSEDELKTLKQVSDQAGSEAARYKRVSGIVNAFNVGFDNAFSNFGRDPGKRDRMGQISAENERYLGQLRDFQTTGIEPGSREWEQAQARHDLIRGDIRREKGRGGWMGNMARDFLSPFWDMAKEQTRDAFKDYVMDKTGFRSWVTGQSNQQATMVQSIAQSIAQATITVQNATINANGASSGYNAISAASSMVGGGLGDLGTLLNGLGGLFGGTGNGGGPRQGPAQAQVLDDIANTI
jgi:hypothetical protein